MPDANPAYDIDYDHLDVADLMRQVRERARAGDAAVDPRLPAEVAIDAGRRLRGYFDLDDRRPHELQQALGLTGDWNVSPEDLRASHPGVIGGVIVAVRRLLRPLTKLLANLDLPLHKQFKVNLGVATAIRVLLQDNDALRRQVAALERRLQALERDRPPEN